MLRAGWYFYQDACEDRVLSQANELELRVSWAAWEEERGEPEAAWNVLALAAVCPGGAVPRLHAAMCPRIKIYFMLSFKKHKCIHVQILKMHQTFV